MLSLRALGTLPSVDEGLTALPRFPSLRELMPMDVPDAGYRHIGQCTALDSLVLMYCGDTTIEDWLGVWDELRNWLVTAAA